MATFFTGEVVSAKMQKTAIVKVERKFRHHKYMKTIIKHKKYKVHYEDMDLKEGDIVKIRESRPISKDKHFVVAEKVNK